MLYVFIRFFMTQNLSKEVAFYARKKTLLLRKGSGKYVVIQGDVMLSFFDDEEEALREGYANFDPNKPFLVRKVSSEESVHSFSPSFEHYGVNTG